MRITHSMIVAFVGGFVVPYFLLPPIAVGGQYKYVTNNINKAYLATISGLFMLFIYIILHDYQYHTVSLHLYCIVSLCIAIFIYLHQTQMFINDKQYTASAIEHHATAIFESKKILEKTDDYNIAKLAKNSISQQTDELSVMTERKQSFNV